MLWIYYLYFINIILYINVDSTILKFDSKSSKFFRDEQQHQEILNEISLKLKSRNGKKITILRSSKKSHCPRSQNYKIGTIQVDITELNKIISLTHIDHDQSHQSDKDSHLNTINHNLYDAIVDVESSMTMEELVDVLLPHGLMPAIVPEFKGNKDPNLCHYEQKSSSNDYRYDSRRLSARISRRIVFVIIWILS